VLISITFSLSAYLIQALGDCLIGGYPRLLGDMYNNVVKCLQGICAKGLAPDQLVKELLNHLARE